MATPFFLPSDHNFIPSAIVQGQSKVTITGITQASPAVVTVAAGHDFLATNFVFFENVGGMVEINRRARRVVSPTATTFEVNINTTGFTAYTTGGDATVTVPAGFGDATVYFNDDALKTDLITALQRAIEKTHEFSVGDSPRPGTAILVKFFDVDPDDKNDDIAERRAFVDVTGMSQADPVVVTCAGGHDYTAGDRVFQRGAAGMVEMENFGGTVASPTATTFEITEIDSTAFTAYTSGGQINVVADIPKTVRISYDDEQPKDRVSSSLIRAYDRMIQLGVGTRP